MDDQAFDKRLADKLKNINDFPFDENNWDKVNSRLRGRSRFSFLPVATALLLLTLLGLNGWMGYQWHNTQQKYSELKAIIDTLKKQETVHQQISYDTIYKQVVVYRYDTAYRTTIYENMLSDKKQARNEQTKALQEYRQVDHKDQQHKDNHQAASSDSLLYDQSAEKTRLSRQVNNEDSISYDVAEVTLDSLANEQEASPRKEDVIPSGKEEKENLFDLHRFSIGASAHLPFVSHPGVSSHVGIGGGLHAEISVSDKLSLAVHGNYLRLYYTLYAPDEKLGITDVNVGSVYQNDELVRINNQQQLLQYGLGIRYTFSQRRKFNPYLSLSYLAETTFNQHLTYKFIDATTEKLYLREIQSAQNLTRWHVLDAELGVERKLSPRLALLLGGYYSTKISQGSVIRPDRLGMRTYWYFHF